MTSVFPAAPYWTHPAAATSSSKTWNLCDKGATGRAQVPPLFLFEKADEWADVTYRGLVVPGSPIVPPDDQLVTIWRTSGTGRYQNYRAVFTVLDVPNVTRAWLADLMRGEPESPNAPTAWTHWVRSGNHQALRAERPLDYRKRADQLPSTTAELALVETIRDHFRGDETLFEPCAAELFRMTSPTAHVTTITRKVVDGGRDAFGYQLIGPSSDPVRLEWSLEAKCYAATTPVTTRHTSRLISRLRHRDFGVIVTTSFVDLQAYREIREDRHPVVIIAAADIVEALKERGLTTAAAVKRWLEAEYPVPTRANP